MLEGKIREAPFLKVESGKITMCVMLKMIHTLHGMPASTGQKQWAAVRTNL